DLIARPSAERPTNTLLTHRPQRTRDSNTSRRRQGHDGTSQRRQQGRGQKQHDELEDDEHHDDAVTRGPAYAHPVDPLDDLPPNGRTEVVAAVCAAWKVDVAGAETILRASEPFWNVLEDHGGVDSWGGGEFCRAFPAALTLIRQLANP